MNVAMLLNCGSFEGYFGGVLKLDAARYLATYRGDWSWYYAKGLLENGIRPILYIPSLDEAGRHETDVGISVRFLPMKPWYRALERKTVKRLSRQVPPLLYLEEYWNTRAFAASLEEALAADDIRLLYVQEYWNARFDHLVSRVRVPVVAADHGGVARGVVKTFKRAAFARAATLYCQTTDECSIVKAYGGPAVLQPNGCDTTLFSPDPTVERSTTILVVARLLDKQKRISDVIRCLALLPETWTLDVVGTGPDLDILTGVARNCGVLARTRFRGFMGRTEVRDAMRRCGVFAMPSDNEAVAIAALEAMGCGASVVLSRIRAFEELVEDGVEGRLVPPRDPAALAVAILDAWTWRDARGRSATEKVRRHYDTRVLYARLAESLRKAAGPGTHSQRPSPSTGPAPALMEPAPGLPDRAAGHLT